VTPTIVILICTALVTLGALVVLLWSVVRRTSTVVADLTALQERIGPDLEKLRRDADITARELEQVSASLERLQQGRRSREDELRASRGSAVDER
jgi:predicted PurR-regulated permease PerM